MNSYNKKHSYPNFMNYPRFNDYLADYKANRYYADYDNSLSRYSVKQSDYPMNQTNFPSYQSGYPSYQPGYPAYQSDYAMKQPDYPVDQSAYPAYNISYNYVPNANIVEYNSTLLYAQAANDFGPNPFVVNINEAAKANPNYRTTLWTGNHLQLTLMSLNAGEDIGEEMHPDVDQFLRIEAGEGKVRMGDTQDKMDFEKDVKTGFAIIIPAGKWHNLINTGKEPLKLYSIYAPPQHPKGTVHKTKKDAHAAE